MHYRKPGYLIILSTPAIIAGLMYLIMFGCEERFNPEIDAKYEDLLVVEGEITNFPGPYMVRLSSSVDLENNLYIPLSGYRVIISDDHGTWETLTETETGVYSTSVNGIQGVVGRKYKIDITSTSGKDYATNFEELRNPVGIDSVYFKLEYIVQENLPFDIEGYQFYLDTETPMQDTNYYLWDLTATYKYQSDFIIRWMYDGQLHPFTNFDSLRTCYTTKKIIDIFTYGTAHLSQPTITQYPLHYVSTEERDLSIRYSLLTRQYTISKEAHDFWSKVKEQNSNAGELYTKQPFQIRSNVFAVGNPEEAVLGHFMVAGVTEKRIFVDRPPDPIKMRYPICQLTEADYMNFGTLFLTTPSEWPQFATYDNNGGNAYPANQDCLDCRLRGGTLEEPEFWINE